MDKTYSSLSNKSNEGRANSNMKILNLIIKQVYFDEILAGTKKEEYRDVKPTTFKKYLYLSCCGKEFDDINKIPNEDPYRNAIVNHDYKLVPIQYDALRLYVGYNKDRDSMLVKVTDVIFDPILDKKGVIRPQFLKTRSGLPIVYPEAELIYELGEILETDIHPKKKNK